MKRIICLITVLCIVLGSFSFCFADFGSTDSNNLYNLSQYTLSIKNLLTQSMPTKNQISTISGNVADIYTRLGTINSSITSLGSKLETIAGYLHVGSNSISSLVNSILSWMQPIYQSVLSVPSDLGVIQGLLGYPTSDGGGTTWHPYLKELLDLDNNTGFEEGAIPYLDISTNGITNSYNYYLTSNWRHSFLESIILLNNNLGRFYSNNYLVSNNGYSNTQNAVNWGNLGTSSFTPISSTDGIYKWFSAIQAPVARLSYVLASDQRIAAQQAAAANEQAVVNNFVDSNGSGSAGVSDIANIASLSSGYKSNFNTQANASGMFNIFNQNNMGWFSQETLDQLDTTQTQTRSLMKSSKPDTPLLDQQIKDIYDQIGVKHD